MHPRRIPSPSAIYIFILSVSSVFGHANTSEGWTMVKMNFSSILPRQCDDDKDFELWSPASHSKVCFHIFTLYIYGN